MRDLNQENDTTVNFYSWSHVDEDPSSNPTVPNYLGSANSQQPTDFTIFLRSSRKSLIINSLGSSLHN